MKPSAFRLLSVQESKKYGWGSVGGRKKKKKTNDRHGMVYVLGARRLPFPLRNDQQEVTGMLGTAALNTGSMETFSHSLCFFQNVLIFCMCVAFIILF